jgi:hypothetical protein
VPAVKSKVVDVRAQSFGDLQPLIASRLIRARSGGGPQSCHNR